MDAVIIEDVVIEGKVKRIYLRLEEYKTGDAKLSEAQEGIKEALIPNEPNPHLEFDLSKAPDLAPPPGYDLEIIPVFEVERAPPYTEGD